MKKSEILNILQKYDIVNKLGGGPTAIAVLDGKEQINISIIQKKNVIIASYGNIFKRVYRFYKNEFQ